MGVDVVDVFGIDPCVGNGVAHGQRGAGAVRWRRGHMVGIAAHTKTDQFRVDACASRLSMFVLVSNQHPGAITKHEAIAVAVPRAARRLGVVITCGKCPRRGKTAQTHWRSGHFCTARQHHVRIPVHDIARCKANAVGAGGACCGHGDIRAAHAVHDGQVTSDHIDDGPRYEKRGHTTWTPMLNEQGAVFNGTNTADSRTDGDADTRCVGLGDLEPRIAHGLDARHHPKLDKRIHFAGIFSGVIPLHREILYRRAKAGGKSGGVKLGYLSGTADAIDYPSPCGFDSVAHRAHHAETGDYYSFTGHDNSPTKETRTLKPGCRHCPAGYPILRDRALTPESNGDCGQQRKSRTIGNNTASERRYSAKKKITPGWR